MKNKLDRILNEVEEGANGHELSWLEIMTAVYERYFGEGVPPFEYTLPDDVKRLIEQGANF